MHAGQTLPMYNWGGKAVGEEAAVTKPLQPQLELQGIGWNVTDSLLFVWGGRGGWHKALVVGSVSLWRRLLASRP